MNNHFNLTLNYQPINNHQLATQAQNKASSSASSIPTPSSHSADSRVDRIGKEHFPEHATAHIPYVNLKGGIFLAKINDSIQKQDKTRASAQKTQQVIGQSKEKRRYSSQVPSKSAIEALYHLSSKEAAETLNISENALRKHCRKYGIKKWPYRSILDTHYKDILKQVGQRLFDQHSNGLVSPVINQSSSSRLPSISQLNLTPLSQSNDKPLTGDAILRRARQALDISNPSLKG